VKQHDTPLAEATTPSLDALKAFSAGSRILDTGNELPTAVPLFKRAVEIDPKFAMAYASMGMAYFFSGEPALSAESARKAFELRDRASDREKFFIAANYELQVTGNLEQARQICELWMRTYPREIGPYGFLGALVYPTFGKFDKGVEVARKMIELDPEFPIGYLQLGFNSQFRGDLEEADKTFQRAFDRKLENTEFFPTLFDIAFLKRDIAGMQRTAALAHGKTGAEDSVTQREGFVLAYSGRLAEARMKSRQAVDLARQAKQPGRSALFIAGAALWEAFFGNESAAQQGAALALTLSTDRDLEYGAALALALSGDSSASHRLADNLEMRFPEDTEVRFTYLPAIRAVLALNHNDAVRAVELLQIAAPYDLGTPLSGAAPGFFGTLYTVYVRGLAYLAAHQGAEAATEFQKILDHRPIVVSDPIGALAPLQLGRALVLSGDTSNARKAYQDFLTLWKDADADIPIRKQAKAEFAKLR
jgi:tetratricopeptide (TPR) repeat protein